MYASSVHNGKSLVSHVKRTTSTSNQERMIHKLIEVSQTTTFVLSRQNIPTVGTFDGPTAAYAGLYMQII